MPKYKLLIEYDGTPFCGWQRQHQLPSVQQAIENAIFNFSGDKITIVAAGRTDTGVHATGQVAHVELQQSWRGEKVRDAINAHLTLAAQPITILSATRVNDQFNARFSAIKRHYHYRILNRRAPPALNKHRVWWVPKKLDEKAMHIAAQKLVGYHDFTTFRASQCQAKSPLRHLDRLDVVRTEDMIEIYASAPSFLHNQIRSFVGSLKEVGTGRWDAEDVQNALEARDRTRCGSVAPALGLYLTQVDYPKDDFEIEE